MSIAGIGSQGGSASQILASLFSRLDTSSTSATSSSTESNSFQPSSTASDGGLTGSTKPSLSSMILGTLMQMQSQSDTASSSSATADGSNGVSQLFSAMDSDGDGSVSQSELESYITNAGGTSDEADQLYSMLTSSSTSSSSTSSSSSGITLDQMASAAPQSRPQGHGGHHHHHGGVENSTSSSSSSIGSDLVNLFDTDGDGSVSQSELSAFLTANGGTSDQATSIFDALTSSSTASGSTLTAANFDNAISNAQANAASNPYASIVSFLDTLSQSGANTVSVSA